MLKAMDSAVSVKNLSFRYKHGREKVLKDLSLEVPSGSMLVIMGRSGAGKSTFCACLNGLIPHLIKGDLEGKINTLGLNPHDCKVADFARLMGIVFQDFESQLFSTTVELEVAFGLENLGIPRNEMKARIEEALKKAGLSELKGRAPSTLSGGQKQRLAIASALALNPALLCLDEPTTDLDPQGKDEVFSITSELWKNEGKTILMVEHETEEALQAEYIALFQGGALKEFGRTREVLNNIDLLKEAGVRPPEIPHLFHLLGDYPLPFTKEDAIRRLDSFELDKDLSSGLEENDREKERGYGNEVISIESVHYDYPTGVKALNNVSLSVRQGEFLAILGQNGSGKTTLVKHFNNLISPRHGKVLLKGEDIQRKSVEEISQTVGLVFQNPDHQIFCERVEEDVAFSLRLLGLSPHEISPRVDSALKAVDLESLRHEDPFSLTKGQRQRVAVASILALRPEILILDEPTTGLDYLELQRMMELIQQLNQQGHTIIMITHSMWVAAEYAHRVVLMKDGRIIADGKTREVFSNGEKIKEAGIQPPLMAALSSRMGFTALSIEEMAHCLKRKSI
jgi:energy-coupling factor transport system ATP-binding protein